MELPIYRNKTPELDENVLVIFTEYKNSHVEAELLEYNLVKGMMIYEDATRKKKIYDWKKEIPLNKPIVAKIEEIFNDTYVKLSMAYFDQKMDVIELRKQLMKPFSENKALVTIIKRICKNNNLEFNNFWSEIMYKLNDEKKDEDINQSLLEFISENIEKFNDLVKEVYPEIYEKITEEFNKSINSKVYKIQSKFSLTTKGSIENTKNLLKLTCDNNNFQYTLKYETTPIFVLESSSENSTIENHNQFLNYLEEHSKTFNVEYIKQN